MFYDPGPGSLVKLPIRTGPTRFLLRPNGLLLFYDIIISSGVYLNLGGVGCAGEGAMQQEGQVTFLDTRLFPDFVEPYDICVICGVLLSSVDDRRSHRVDSFLYNLEVSWFRTSFTWECISSLCRTSEASSRLTTCCRCTNWLRRCNRFKERPRDEERGMVGSKGKKVFLPLDELIAFSVAPGEGAMPDIRNVKRLFNVIMNLRKVKASNGGEGDFVYFRNYYFNILPSHLQLCFKEFYANHGCFHDMDKKDGDNTIVLHIIKAWWVLNNHTVIFRNPKTSNLIRKVNKLQDERSVCADE
eukprot:749197-Hanusia_phi.AAC.2